MDPWEELNNVPAPSFNIPLVRPSPVYGGQSIDNPYVNGISMNGPMYHNDMQHEIMEPNYLGLYNIPNGHQTNVGSAIMSSYSTLTNEDHHQTANMAQSSYEQEMNYCHFYNSTNSTNNNVNSHEENILTELISNNQEPINMAPNLIEMAPHHHAYEDLDRPSTSRGHIESSNDSLASDRIRSSGEWMENCPEQMHTNGQDYAWMRQAYYSSAFGPSSSHDIPSTSSQQTPQKKHHMYGRRSFPYDDNGIDVNMFNEDLRNYSNISYGNYPVLSSASDVFPSSSMIRTNEPNCDMMSRNRTKNPKDKRCFRENGKLSKDEKKAKENEIPLSMDDIVNLPIDEFNDRLAKHELSDTQLSLARDIRRRGKNKVAAQNCRKRKLDQIIGLQREFDELLSRKYDLERDQKDLLEKANRMKAIVNKLNQYVNQNQCPKFNPNSYN